MAEAVAAAGPEPEVVLEATFGWYWAVDVLEELGARVRLAHPLGNDGGNRRVKNDERDAADLVELLRLGRLAEAWIAPPDIRELREMVRYRHKLVQLRSGDPTEHGSPAAISIDGGVTASYFHAELAQR